MLFLFGSIRRKRLSPRPNAWANELRHAEFSAKELKVAKFTSEDLRAGGYSALQLVEEGFGAEHLRCAGYSARELLNPNV